MTVGSPVRFSLRVNNDLDAWPSSPCWPWPPKTAGFDQLWVSNDLLLRSAPVLAARWPPGPA